MYADQSNFRTHKKLTGVPSCSQWTIYRTMPGPEQTLTIVSTDQNIYDLHYYMGRTTVCRVDGCAPCLRKHLARPYGHVLAVLNKLKTRVLFEYPESAAAQLQLVQEQRGSLRGLLVNARRTSKRINAKVVFTFHGFIEDFTGLPANENTWHASAHLFGLHVDARPRIKDAPINPPMGSEAHDELIRELALTGESDYLNASRHPAAGQAVLLDQPEGRKINRVNGQHKTAKSR